MNIPATNSFGLTKNPVEGDLHRLREATGQIVGSVFFGTLLKSMRESKLQGPFGHGGRGEEVFAGQLHGIWAEKAGQTTKGGIADALYNRLSHQQKLIRASRAAMGGDQE